jgi:hypothetical protein
MVVMMVMVMMVAVLRCYHLRLRRDWSGEAEDNDEPEQKLLHAKLDADCAWGTTRPQRPAALRARM